MDQDHLIKRVLDLHSKDKTYSLLQISEILNISYQKLYYILRTKYPDVSSLFSIKRNGRKDFGRFSKGHQKRRLITDDQLDIVKSLYYVDKQSFREIGIKYGGTAETVWQFFKRHNLQPRTWQQGVKIAANKPEFKERQRKLASEGKIGVFRQQKYGNTKPEKEFKQYLELLGCEYIHQYKIPEYYHLYDFYLPKKHLIVEIDGEWWHSSEKQKQKDYDQFQFAKQCGYKIIRITDKELKNKRHERLREYFI